MSWLCGQLKEAVAMRQTIAALQQSFVCYDRGKNNVVLMKVSTDLTPDGVGQSYKVRVFIPLPHALVDGLEKKSL